MHLLLVKIEVHSADCKVPTAKDIDKFYRRTRWDGELELGSCR